MTQVWRAKCFFALFWLSAGHLGQAALIRGAASTAASRAAVVEDLLEVPDAPAQISAALQADRKQSGNEGPQALRLSLMKLGLPVPPEVREMAEWADASKKVSPDEADRTSEAINNMLQEQHWLLDHKVIECRQKRRALGEAIQDAAAEVRNLASDTSSSRSIIVEATSRMPQDKRAFEEIRWEADIGRARCKGASASEKARAESLKRDSAQVLLVQQALSFHCGGKAASFAQEPGDDDVDAIIAGAESALRGQAATNAKQRKALQDAGCPGVAAALGVVAKSRGGKVAASFLQDMDSPISCKLNAHTCAAMIDVAAEVHGEIADSQARLKADSASAREACAADEEFAKNQLGMETSQFTERSGELRDATWKAGEVGDLANQKDRERQKLNAELKAVTAKCTADISDILYGKMCALQKVRDSLQVLAGRKELPEDCQVTDWDESACSKSCGGGQKQLTRKVILSPKGGAACPPLKLHLKCAETPCPKDCKVTRWTGWSACSAQCDGGIQERNRVVSQQPEGNGAACPHLVDMRLCNGEACSSDCKFRKWTSWSPCSKACGGGTRSRSRGLRDEGKASCPAADSKDRLDFQKCNSKKCEDKEAKCGGAKMDVVLLLDASGSIGEEGLATLKKLSLELVRLYAPSKKGTKVSVASFAKQASVISSLSEDARELSNRIDTKLSWMKGPGNFGPALSRATSLLAAGGRKTAKSLVLVVSDGRIVDPFLAKQAAERLKKNGVRLAFALAGKDYKNDVLENMASLPEKDNTIQLPSLKDMAKDLQSAAKTIVTGTCSDLA